MREFGVFGFNANGEMVDISNLYDLALAENLARILNENGATVSATGIAFSRVHYGKCDYCVMDGDESEKVLPFYNPDLDLDGYPYATRGCAIHAADMAESLFCYVHDC